MFRSRKMKKGIDLLFGTDRVLPMDDVEKVELFKSHFISVLSLNKNHLHLKRVE